MTRAFQSKHCTVVKLQGLVDAGLKDCVDSGESVALWPANTRIKALEKELQLVEDVSEIYDSESFGLFCRLHVCDISGWDAKSPA